MLTRGHFVLVLTSTMLATGARFARGETFSIPAVRDGFVREQAPTLNYGGAGSLCVAGVNSLNAAEEPRGRFDSVIEFDPADIVATQNTTYGVGGWNLTAIQLRVSEQGTPQNPIFPRGTGLAQCAWMPNATFSEGSGTPTNPVTGLGDDLTWNHLQFLMSGSPEQLLCELSGEGFDGPRICNLPITGVFAQALRAGQTVTLHLSPVTTSLGFTVHSRNFSDPQLRPMLIIEVEPVLAGDVNCDNQLDIQDASALVMALVDPDAFEVNHPGCDIDHADVDHNGLADGRDISRLIELLMMP